MKYLVNKLHGQNVSLCNGSSYILKQISNNKRHFYLSLFVFITLFYEENVYPFETGVFIFVTFVLNKRTMNMWRNTASTRNARSSTNTRQTRVSKFTKATGTSSSTNQLHNSKEEQRETGFTNPQHSSIKNDEQN